MALTNEEKEFIEDLVKQEVQKRVASIFNERDDSPVLFIGREVCPTLASDVVDNMKILLGKPFSQSPLTDEFFGDLELRIKLGASVRELDIYILMSTHAPGDNWLELFLLLAAAKSASASRRTAILSYMGYARQDKKTTGREPVSSALFSHLIEESGATSTVSIDIHSGQIQGSFRAPMDHLSSLSLFGQHIKQKVVKNGWEKKKIIVVSPDAGGGDRAKLLQAYLISDKKLNLDVDCVIANKSRNRNGKDDVSLMTLDRKKIPDSICLIVDDIGSTFSSLRLTAMLISECSPCKIIPFVCHGIFAPGYMANLTNVPFTELYTTNSTPFPMQIQAKYPMLNIKIISLGSLIAGVIKRKHEGRGQSVSELFSEELPLKVYHSEHVDQKVLFDLIELHIKNGDAIQAQKQILLLKGCLLSEQAQKKLKELEAALNLQNK